jgi:hypothetical protein
MKGITKKVFVDYNSKVVITVLTDKFGSQFKGEARCSGDDVFNVDFGSKLSYLRAKRAMAVAYKNDATDEINIFGKLVIEAVNNQTKFTDIANSTADKIKEVLNIGE